MKRRKVFRSALVLLLALMFLISSAACTSGNDNANNTTASAQVESTVAEPEETVVEEVKDPVTITVLMNQEAPIAFADTDVGKEIKRILNTTVEYMFGEDEKIKVLLAGGDLPDIVMLKPEFQKQTIEGGAVIAMDELLATNGQDIVKTVPKVVDFMKKFRSNDTGKLYFLPTNSGPDMMGFEASLGVITRWDFYKELGYPKINNEDDLLNILKQMMDKHPKTDEGSKVYGVAAWNDWGLWPYFMPMAILYGYSNFGPNGYVVKTDTNDVSNNYTNADSPLWKTVSFYYKARKLDILDPDSLTMQSGDFGAKIGSGQLLYAPASWFNGGFNGKNNANVKGFATIPLEWGYQWNGADQLGWFDKSWGISKNCKTPDRAMDLINFLWSYEGSRLAYSGVKGVHWDIKDGAPTIADTVIKTRTEQSDAWRQTGLRDTQAGIYCGLGNFVINPEDNTELDLFSSASSFSLLLDPLTKDYCDYYKVRYPAEIFLKNVESGKSMNQKDMDTRLFAAVANPTDDIKRIDVKLDEIMIKAVAKAIMAKDDADFEAVKQKTLEDLKAAGAETANDWWMKAWADAKAAIAQ